MRPMTWILALSLFLAANTLIVQPLQAQDDEEETAEEVDDTKPRAPTFVLEDLGGEKHDSSEQDGLMVLAWINKDCPYVQRHYQARTLQKLAEKYAEEGVTWWAIDSTHDADKEALLTWKKEQKIKEPILLDSDGKVGRAFGATNTPHMFVLRDGVIVYQGALDDWKKGDEKKKHVNYVAAALDALIAGKEVEVAKTEPYGCNVKYLPPPPAETATIERFLDIEKARAEAKKRSLPVMIEFTGSDWSPPCKRYFKEVAETESFKTWAGAKVVVLSCDFPRHHPITDAQKEHNTKLRDQYNVEGIPMIVFIDPNGQERGRTGYELDGVEAWITAAELALAQ